MAVDSKDAVMPDTECATIVIRKGNKNINFAKYYMQLQEYKFSILFHIILDYLHQLQAYNSTYVTNNT
jgi:hypothetical protein